MRTDWLFVTFHLKDDGHLGTGLRPRDVLKGELLL